MADFFQASDVKKNYYKSLLSENKKERAEEVKNLDEYTAIYKYEAFHPEEVVSSAKINRAFYETGLDIISLDNEIAIVAEDYDNLLTEYEDRIRLINENIKAEQNRLEDYNLISGKFGFDYYIDLKQGNFQGNFDYHNNGYFSAYSYSAKQVELMISNVTGNGYEGNKYAYRNNKFLIDITDTTDRSLPFDGKRNTYYEYSRINTTDKNIETTDIHFDEDKCKCSITIESATRIELFNTIQIATEISNLVLERIDISYDEGKTFITYLEQNIPIKDMETKYTTATDYYYSVITFPDTNVVRLSFSSTSQFVEKLAKKIDEENIEFIENSARSVILLNEITAYNSKYEESSMVSDTFTIDKAHDVAIYSEEKIYGSDEIESSIEYILNINGTDYPIVPINSERDGVQLIKTSDFEYYNPKTTLITDKISSAYLTVNFKPVAESKTGFCKNIKICVRY